VIGTGSLRRQLLAWLLIPLSLLTALDLIDDYVDAQRTAGIVFDRLLLASARSIAHGIEFDGEVAHVKVSRGAIEAFAWPQPDRVYYRVSDARGRVLAGTPGLPRLEDVAFEPEEPTYQFAELDGVRLRTVGFLQPMPAGTEPVMVEVAATLHGRDVLAHDLWVRNARQAVLVLVLAALLAWIGLTRGLGPLRRLGRAVTARDPESLDPLSPGDVQSELTPLVSAINQYTARLTERVEAQRRFIANASHQLRTPLTLLNTQVHYALATDDVAAKDEALRALRDGIRHSNRIANQLLTLSRTEAGSGIPATLTPVDLDAVVHLALEKVATLAERRNIDLGADTWTADGSGEGDRGRERPIVLADEVLLLELVVNLVDNAVRYTPPGGQVTVATVRDGGGWRLTVTDSGPGIPLSERERVFERFYRAVGTEGEGSGLGLAIVREIARALHATVGLDAPAQGSGLVATVSFPAASESPTPQE
jgi:two-component system sensor histidine kinase TctE